MKKIADLLVFALSIGMLAGCGGSKKGPVTIQFMETLTSPDRTKYIKTLLTDFEAQNQNIKVELVSVPWDQAHDKIMTQIASKQLPDVVEMSGNWNAEMAATEMVENLGPYYDKWEQKDEISLSTLNLAKGYHNTLYAIPYGLFIRAMYYRPDWIKENNLSIPKTYDELFQTAEKLTNASKNKYGYSFRGGKGCWTQLINTVMTQTGQSSYFDKDGKCILRQPKAIEAFKQYANLYKKAAPKDSLNWGYNEKVIAFTTGVTGLLLQDSDVVATCEKTMKEGTFATAPLPVGPDGKRYVMSGYVGFSMFNTSKNKDASWKLISYLTDKKVNTEWNKKTSTMPVMKSALKDPFFNTGYIKAWTDTAADPNTVFFSHPDYLPEWGAFFAKESETGLQNYLLNKQSAEDTMNKWAQFLEDANKKYNKK